MNKTNKLNGPFIRLKVYESINKIDAAFFPSWTKKTESGQLSLTRGTGTSKNGKSLPNGIVGTALVRLTRAVSSRLQNKQPSIFQEWT